MDLLIWSLKRPQLYVFKQINLFALPRNDFVIGWMIKRNASVRQAQPPPQSIVREMTDAIQLAVDKGGVRKNTHTLKYTLIRSHNLIMREIAADFLPIKRCVSICIND